MRASFGEIMWKYVTKFLNSFWFSVLTTALVVTVGLRHLPPPPDRVWLASVILVLAAAELAANYRARKAVDLVSEMVVNSKKAKNIIEDVIKNERDKQ